MSSSNRSIIQLNSECAEADVVLALADPILYPAIMPYGLQILLDSVRREGIRATLTWPYLYRNPRQALKEIIFRSTPKIVGISFRNLDNAGFHFEESGEQNFIDDLYSLVQCAREFECIIALGGSGFSINPSALLEQTGADVGFVGPCESDFTEFCRLVIREGHGAARAVSGIKTAFMRGTAAPKPDKQPLYTPRLMDGQAVEYAKLVGGMIPLRTKSGCSMRCTYCVVPSIERLNLKPWEDVRNELRMIVHQGVGDRVFIADGEFNLPSIERAVNFSQNMREAFGDSIKWRCYLEAGLITRQLVESIRNAGCIGVSLTVDSFSDQPRRGLGKRTGARSTVEAVRLCGRAGFSSVMVNLIFGGPYETLETAKDTAQIASELHESGITLNVTFGLRVYPNTPLSKIAMKAPFKSHYRYCKSIPWLGTFCSPVPPPKLAEHILPILPVKKGINYNHWDTGYNEFYQEVAWGSTLLYYRRFEQAENHFIQMIEKHGKKRELELGFLKAKARVSESDEDRWSFPDQDFSALLPNLNTSI